MPMTNTQPTISLALLDMLKPADPLQWMRIEPPFLARPQGGIPARTAVLWQADLDAIAPTKVSEAELQRAGRFRKPIDRQRFLTARGFLREVLAGYLHCHPSDIPFAYGPFGKPFVPQAPVHFNASRSGGIALVALACSPVGVDIEQIIPRPDLDAMAKAFLMQEHARAYELAEPPRRLDYFYYAWTRGEALIKAAGLSLADVSRMPGLLGGISYDTHSFNPRPGYVASISVRGAPDT